MTEQRTDEWFAARLGKVTASRIADLTAKTKSGWGASRANYMAELLVERVTGQRWEGFKSDDMVLGTEIEGDAIDAFEFYQCVKIDKVGFIPHPTIEMAGASPDGLVGDKGLVEFKCPKPATHLEFIMAATGKNNRQAVPGKYQKQIQWQLACTGRDVCTYASFQPFMPEHLKLWTVEIERDETVIAELETSVRDFLSELETMIDKLPPDPAQKAKVVNA